jgi:outer membrane protein assembly factor BamD
MSLRTLALGPRWIRAATFAAMLASGFVLSACADDADKKEPEYVERPVEEIYNAALKLVRKEQWTEAAKQFDEVERQHPYSVWARRATLMSAFCYYQANKYDDVITTADRYIQLHPGNKDVAYAYYLKAVSLYEQIVDVGRDQQKTQDALTALEDLTQRFPGTDYARDAQLKIDLTRDHLAGKEMEVGRYYLRQGEYIAAINRFRVVVEKYQTTSHVPEALERLTEAYMALGIVKEAQTAAAVLGYNYPGSDWYHDSYALLTKSDLAPKEDKASWISKAFRAVF